MAGVPGLIYYPIVNEEAKDLFFDFDSKNTPERDLLEYDFIEAESGVANETLVLMLQSSFMSPNK